MKTRREEKLCNREAVNRKRVQLPDQLIKDERTLLPSCQSFVTVHKCDSKFQHLVGPVMREIKIWLQVPLLSNTWLESAVESTLTAGELLHTVETKFTFSHISSLMFCEKHVTLWTQIFSTWQLNETAAHFHPHRENKNSVASSCI